MGVNDHNCRTCGADIRSLPPQAAFCLTCYLEYRYEQDQIEDQIAVNDRESFMALDDEEKWEKVYDRLFSN